MLSTIPFAGFYYSVHDRLLDNEMYDMFCDEDGNAREELVNHAVGSCDWSQVHTNYAKEYTQVMADELQMAFTFHSMVSPKEYNFETDRIIVTIEQAEVERLLATVDPTELAMVCKRLFTSRDGFYSYYSPDYKTWGEVAGWDQNQVGALVLAHYEGGMSDVDDELDIMEDYSNNGAITRWIEAATPDIQRLYKINDYLNTRQSR